MAILAINGIKVATVDRLPCTITGLDLSSRFIFFGTANTTAGPSYIGNWDINGNPGSPAGPKLIATMADFKDLVASAAKLGLS